MEALWLECTITRSSFHFDRERTPELEFKTNFNWLAGERAQD